MNVRRGLTISLLAFVAPATARAQFELVGITWSGDTMSIDMNTGASVFVGHTGHSDLNSLACDAAGRLLTANASSSGTPKLWQLDPVLGTTKFAYEPFLNDIRALAFSPSGVLYGISNGPPFAYSALYVFNLSAPPGSTSIRTLIGGVFINGNGFQGDSVQGLDFASDGTLYGWGGAYGLITIDPATAFAHDVNGVIDGSSVIQTLSFAPDGRLFGAYDDLYSIDRATGALTLVGGPIAGGVRGMEFVPALPRSYCTGKLNSIGCRPTINWSGTPSASTGSGFSVSASSVPIAVPAQFVFSLSGALVTPFAGGALCERPPYHRTRWSYSGGLPPTNNCTGALQMDFNAYLASTGLSASLAGATLWGQFVGRDPSDASGFMLSNAIRFPVGP